MKLCNTELEIFEFLSASIFFRKKNMLRKLCNGISFAVHYVKKKKKPRSVNLSVKGKIVNIFSTTGHIVSVSTTWLCWAAWKSHGWHRKRQTSFCYKKTSIMCTEICISYTFQASWKIFILLFFYQPFKNIKPFLGYGVCSQYRVSFGPWDIVCPLLC